jgi:hypothetical protein
MISMHKVLSIGWIFLLGMVFSATGACAANQESAGLEHSDSEQRFLFDVFYVNYAWGYTLKGFYIDNGGHVYVYDHSNKPWSPADKNHKVLTQEDLLAKYRNAKQVTSVSQDELEKHAAMISVVEKGAIERSQKGFDMGSQTYLAYNYDVQTNAYKPILLTSEGDWLEKNSEPDAQILVNWLKSIQNQVKDSFK